MAQEQIEEYLETIFDIAGNDGTAKTTAIARQLNVAPASVTESLRNLERKGLIDYEPYSGAKLTPEGLDVVTRLKRRHRLFEVFLSDVLKIDPNKVHSEACRIEHYISDETADALCHWLEAPSRSPHGKPISPCQRPVDSCDRCRETTVGIIRETGENGILKLTELGQNQHGIIAFLRGNRAIADRILGLGLAVNMEVQMLSEVSSNGPVDVLVNGERITISSDISEHIFVCRLKP